GQSEGFLSVTVTGTNPHYQWYLSNRITGAELAIGGATLNNYLAPQPGDYFCRITNDCGTVDSNIGTVIAGVACGPAGVFTVTDDQTVTAGESATLSVTPSGSSPFDYQWFQAFPDGSRTPIGTTRDITVTPTAEVSQYYVTVTNTCGSGSSRVITFTLCHPPAITAQPVAPLFTSFNETGTLSVIATGTNLHYTWYANNVARAVDAPSITIAPPTIATGYRCTVTGDCGTVDSDFVIVNPPCIKPSIAQQPISQNITAGFSATLSLTASGNTPLTVSWFSADGTPVGTGASINVSPSVTTSYYAVVSNACGTATSDTVMVAVVPGCTAPAITTQPQNVTIAQGNSTTLHVVATGDAPLQYQWYTSSGVQVPGGTNASVTVAPLQTQIYYV
ncbi:MAG TPA: hypothetical protein VKJ07_19210, partial [Mycobacteriales bacterium]|nr:hypothetical protein [Mycobacteriales bacterium]